MDENHPDYWKYEEIKLFEKDIRYGRIEINLGLFEKERSVWSDHLDKVYDEILNMHMWEENGKSIVSCIQPLHDSIFELRMKGRLKGIMRNESVETQITRLESEITNLQSKYDKKREENLLLLEELKDKTDLLDRCEKAVLFGKNKKNESD